MLTKKIILILFSGILVLHSQCFSRMDYLMPGNGPQSVATADFNEDGYADIAVANVYSHNISLMFGDGTGNFTTPTNISTGYYPFSIIAQDLNVDGNIDLATASFSDNSISILYGNGLGGFGAYTNFSIGLGNSPEGLISADFNEDFLPDLATANLGSDNVSVLLNTGSGFIDTNFSIGGDEPRCLAAADFNEDGNLDLVSGNGNSTNISLLFGDGAGSFPSMTTIVIVGSFPRTINTSDFNEDGNVDILVNGGNNMLILFGDGIGGFDTTIYLPTGTLPLSSVVTDFNGDGHMDVASANFASPGTISLWYGEGALSFSNPTSFNVGTAPRGIAVDDFNSDGAPDLVTANITIDSITVLLQTENPIATITALDPTTFCFGTAVNIVCSAGDHYLWSTGSTANNIYVSISDTVYAQVVSNVGCISDTSNMIVLSAIDCTALEEQHNYLNIYPNPAVNFISIQTSEETTSVQIVDIWGKVIHTYWNTTTLDISSLNNGIYMVKVFIANTMYQKKIIKI